MHFSKTYAALLLSLPSELREDVIEYRALKKLINKVVAELDAFGLSHDVLQRVQVVRVKAEPGLASTPSAPSVSTIVTEELGNASTGELPSPLASTPSSCLEEGEEVEVEEILTDGHELSEMLKLSISDSSPVEIIYELAVCADKTLQPRLCLRIVPDASSMPPATSTPSDPGPSTLPSRTPTKPTTYILPLSSDSAFYTLLSSELSAHSNRLSHLHASFLSSLDVLSRAITHTALPLSASQPNTTGRFTPVHTKSTAAELSSSPSESTIHSLMSLPHSAPSKSKSKSKASSPSKSSSTLIGKHAPSDLSAWRALLTLYADAEIFTSLSERDRGERPLSDAEARLTKFLARVDAEGFADKLVLRESKTALDDFVRMNGMLLDMRKWQYANAEAFRKILKKHTKRTALPLLAPGTPSPISSSSGLAVSAFDPSISASSLDLGSALSLSSLLAPPSSSLPLTLLQSLTSSLQPILPALSDYSCPICTSLAYLPVRLACTHLFCVRCLVKLQRANKSACPQCRRETVLEANKDSVDRAMVNLMRDWFPEEVREKVRESREEVKREMNDRVRVGWDTEGCVVM